ncbi:methylated-DNA--[protein]-cysteine S-methyltransferase [Kiloniella antarctica]|uniref:Methylated-DNA--protein-cysteine methyltransferase n=1 Tax=Kiloniella antarctica TaxID=1550907 RepID=A0ABW5BFK6_9PROT
MPQLTFLSPQGYLKIVENDGNITHLNWVTEQSIGLEKCVNTDLLLETKKQVLAYFEGKKTNFLDLPLSPKGTQFQQNVWTALSNIQYGKVKTYGDIAREVGSVARAVGGACGANPIPIIIPCHRVIAGNQNLGGFSGGQQGQGDQSKKELLLIEGFKLFEDKQPDLPGL